jgi:UDP-GlcNAc:undecaprenyl-phosphate GlcNAc-1-phosphate transferase
VSEYILTLLVTAAITYLLTPLVRRGAIKAKAMHEARDRDVHVVPMPLLGGLAMYGGLVAGLLAADHMTRLRSVFAGTNQVLGLLLAGGLIAAVGAVDDRWRLNWISKLAGQVAAGAILVATGTQLDWLPLPGRGTFAPTPNQSMALTILVVVATINAVNFIDGLDGLAAGIVAIAAVSFFVYYYRLTQVLHLSGEAGPALASAVLAGMCIGFLPHNFYPARIFMGDTGAMLLGLLLAYVPISSISSLDPVSLAGPTAYRLGTVNRFPEILPVLLPVAILVIPYGDLLLAVVRRTRAGRSPMQADRQHLHYRLLDIGHTHRASVLIMYLWAALFSATVVWLSIQKSADFVFVAVTLGAVLVLLLMSLPRLRWWQHPGKAGQHAMAQSAAVAVHPPGQRVPGPAGPAAPGPAADRAPAGRGMNGGAATDGAVTDGAIPGGAVPGGGARGGAVPGGAVTGGPVPGGPVPGGPVPGSTVAGRPETAEPGADTAPMPWYAGQARTWNPRPPG